jgi:2-keto-4-pentenoate hydratase/2-oxohepta-3-ene-1,7-dioic acid hydratase in catechol pathway
MRLLMYMDKGTARLGALQGNEVVDLQALAEARGETLPADILGLIDAGPETLERVKSLLAGSDSDTAGSCRRSATNLELLPPLNPPRGNVLAIGHNYMEHAQESARASGGEITRPTVFTKAQTSINGPYSDIPVNRSVTDQVDWEAELGVVIGRAAKDIPRDQALDYVFGYTVVNDVSARDLQFGWGGQFFKGKSLDGFCPVGPWIVTADEVPDPQTLRLCLRVNGETKQDGNTNDMIFPVDELVAQLSLGMTLPPGTLIATGTPAGVGFARDPKEFLKNGDVMETEIESIGCLRNRIVDAAG